MNPVLASWPELETRLLCCSCPSVRRKNGCFLVLWIGVISDKCGKPILAGRLVKLMRWHGKEGQMSRAVAPSKFPACWLMGGPEGLGEPLCLVARNCWKSLDGA